MGLGPHQCDLPGALHALPAAPRAILKRPKRSQGVWCFCRRRRDGRARVAGRPVARRAREPRQPACFVVNCNLQRLDGPVRRQRQRGRRNSNRPVRRRRLERHQAALWSSDWDRALRPRPRQRADRETPARRRSTASSRNTPSTKDGALQPRGQFFNKYPELQALVAGHVATPTSTACAAGGHDPVKIYAAFARGRMNHTGPAHRHPRPDEEGLRAWAIGAQGKHDDAPAEEAGQTKRSSNLPRPLLRCRSADEQVDEDRIPSASPNPTARR